MTRRRYAARSRVHLSLWLSVAVLASIALVADHAHAVPRQTLMTGTPCSACHVNMQGGGMRTEIGWGSMAEVGALGWDQVGFNWLHNRMSNEIVPRVGFGYDMRAQLARIGRPIAIPDAQGNPEIITPEREFFVMQVQPYLSAEVTDWLQLYATWAATRQTFRDGEACSEDFAGQSCFEAQAIFRPAPHLPTVRVGMLQPSVGIRHDDHTLLIRTDAGRSVIPASYAELGGEVTWQPIFWFQGDVGAYRAENLSRSLRDPSVATKSNAAVSARVRFSPRVSLGSNHSLTTWTGGSVYAAGEFLMINGFVGTGLLDRVSLFIEVANLRYGGDQDRTTLNLSSMLSVRIVDWLIANARLEESNTEFFGNDVRTRAFVAGVEFFPIPWLELRPEYRILGTSDFRMGQYTFQIHLFY